MAKRKIDVLIGNVAFVLAMAIIFGGFILGFVFSGLFMDELMSPTSGAVAALSIILLYVLFLINGICSLRGLGFWWWSLTKGLISFIFLILFTPFVVKMLGTSIEFFYGSINRYFYLAKDALYGIMFLVLALPVVGMIFKVRRSMKSKKAITS
jgi:hypothetical protein